MSWELVEEIGLTCTGRATAGVALEAPVFAQPTPDGGLLVVEELAGEKNLTVQLECRTLRLARDGTLLFDSLRSGFVDAWGCVQGDGSMVLLRRAQWELCFLDPQGGVLARVDLSRASHRMPRQLCATGRGSFVVTFVDRVFEVDIVELDRRGAILWFLPRASGARLGCPSTAQRLDDGTTLVADEFCHVVLEFDARGAPTWQAGAHRDPGRHDGRLSNPSSLRRLRNGGRLIADTRNHRVTLMDAGGAVRALAGDWHMPSYAEELPGGGFLVCDSADGRVALLDAGGAELRSIGERRIAARSLSFPRSVEHGAGGALWIADTANDRVAEWRAGRARELPVAGPPLFWPRSARRTRAGGLLVADGRNARVVELAPDGTQRRELRSLALGSGLELGDPHDASDAGDGAILVVDALRELVALVDWSGGVRLLAGGPAPPRLKDPHSAQLLDGGTLLVADTGQHRLVWIDARGQVVRELDAVIGVDGELHRLERPRHALARHGLLYIVDSGNDRVLVADGAGRLVWMLDHVPGSPLSRLRQPRWVDAPSRDELFVSDHLQHRILHLRRGTP